MAMVISLLVFGLFQVLIILNITIESQIVNRLPGRHSPFYVNDRYISR